MSRGIGTLTLYPQMKALWYGPKTKIEMKIRDTRRYTTHYHEEDILRRLAEAKAKLNGTHELPKVSSTGTRNAA